MLLVSRLLVFILFNGFPTHALVPCDSRAEFSDAAGFARYIQKIAVYGSVDKRKSEEDYAKAHNIESEEIKAKFAATGEFYCHGYFGTAQVTYKSDIITTAGHMIRDQNSCAEKGPISDCTFKYTWQGVVTSIPVESVAMTGIVCPVEQHPRDDWAVLKLKFPAKNLIPYRVPGNGVNPFYDGLPIVAVGKAIDFCVRDTVTKRCLKDKTGTNVMQRYAQDCQMHRVDSDGVSPALFRSDCDSAEGSSGGSILSGELTYPTLLGIDSGGSERHGELQRALQKGVPNTRPYDDKNWAEFDVPIAGEFLDAILKAGGS